MTKQPTARELIQVASNMGAALFDKDGELRPLWHAVRANGEHGVISPPGFRDGKDKDMVTAAMRKVFKDLDVVAYVFMCESWMLTGMDKDVDVDAAFRDGIHEDPRRVECLWYGAEDAAGSLTAYQLIERPAGQKARLGPLQWQERATHSEGRFVGMLPVKGRVH